MATDQRTTRARLAAQRERFGGINWGAAFFGWLSANGLAVLLIAFISAAGLAIGLTTTSGNPQLNRQRLENSALGPIDTVRTIGLAGGLAVLLILALAYFAGGYVAGRMSRFDGVRQGFAVWIIGVLVVFVLAAAGAGFGAKYNLLNQLDLPRIPVDEGTATRGAVVALIAALLITALAAATGGKVGQHYHSRVDRAAMSGPRERRGRPWWRRAEAAPPSPPRSRAAPR
jgi:hypothetical protein